ncbi:MAG: hypothetical protein U0787_00065 [Polyangia bacterium]
MERSELLRGRAQAGDLLVSSLNEKGLEDGVLVQVASVEASKGEQVERERRRPGDRDQRASASLSAG